MTSHSEGASGSRRDFGRLVEGAKSIVEASAEGLALGAGSRSARQRAKVEILDVEAQSENFDRVALWRQ